MDISNQASDDFIEMPSPPPVPSDTALDHSMFPSPPAPCPPSPPPVPKIKLGGFQRYIKQKDYEKLKYNEKNEKKNLVENFEKKT